MRKQIEVEFKYRAGGIDKNEFISKLKKFKATDHVSVYSPDTYYENDCGKVLRWRVKNKGGHELTVKHRTTEKSSLVRKESDLIIGEGLHAKAILHFIKDLGFEKKFRLYKDCEIFFFNHKRGSVSVVFYTVHCKGFRTRDFIEIEAKKGTPIEEAKDLVKYWEEKLELKAHQRLNSTLYEIYSGKSTELLD